MNIRGYYEAPVAESGDWYTPKDYFEALGLMFDLDPCSPGVGLCHVPAREIYAKCDDGLIKPWHGRVFVNPDWKGRHAQVPWLRKFLAHGDGIMIVRAYTSAGWFHQHVPRAHGILFPRGKTKFVRPNGAIGDAPAHGVALLSMGQICTEALRQSGLGWFIEIENGNGRALDRTYRGPAIINPVSINQPAARMPWPEGDVP